MADIFREAPFGQLMHFINPNWFAYPEENPDFEYLSTYTGNGNVSAEKDVETNEVVTDDVPTDAISTRASTYQEGDNDSSDLEHQATIIQTTTMSLQRTQTLPYTAERLAVENTLQAEKTKSKVIKPVATADGNILVDWYKTDDPANPQNWSPKKKFFVAFQIDIYTFVVYATSAIFISSEQGLMEAYGVGEFKVALGLALYVLGCKLPCP